MDKPALVVVIVVCSVAAAGADNILAKLAAVQGAQSSRSSSAPSKDSLNPQSFEGTWQGVWRGYGVVNHHESGSQSSLTVTIVVKVPNARKVSGGTTTSAWQHQPVENAWLSLDAPQPPAPPPPPLPTPPPSGTMLNPRTDGRALIFEVKEPDGKLVDFRLSLEGPDAGTLTVTIPTHSRVYPEFQVKRVG
jgi:hypothetical protein